MSSTTTIKAAAATEDLSLSHVVSATYVIEDSTTAALPLLVAGSNVGKPVRYTTAVQPASGPAVFIERFAAAESQTRERAACGQAARSFHSQEVRRDGPIQDHLAV